MRPEELKFSYLHSNHPVFQVVHQALVVVLASGMSQNGQENEKYGGFHLGFG